MLTADHISKLYKKGASQTSALTDISFEVNKGEYLAIMGPSGSGKSTLMHIMGLLDIPSSGKYLIDGKNTAELSSDYLATLRNKKIGFVFQSFNLLPRATALENVILPLKYGDSGGTNRKAHAETLLKTVGLGKRLYHSAGELSGGEMQRVAIARALVMNPDIILADEPTGNIASEQGKEILDLFERLNQKGHTVILITHDLGVASRSRRIIKIQDGRVISDKPNTGKRQ